MNPWYLVVPLAPLAGAIVAGFFGRAIGRAGAHTVTILGVLVSFIASCVVGYDVVANGNTFNGPVYEWATVGDVSLEIGFLIDRLTVLMMIVVTFVSLCVHVYTIGYMHDDPGYQRFFSYISLFTFSMLMLVMSNNFLQLFFGWEAVGLVSYLLIGFWYTRPSAIYANLKAFLVNRVGDFGFLLGIGLVLAYTGSLDYAEVFAKLDDLAPLTLELIPGLPWMLVTVICICLFIGAMGKSAQFPLHVWLPDSMEGPTPISALIHAATMVTAGIFMVTRMSPLFELSDTALSFVLIIGAITAFFMSLIAIVQYDIKRVVAYSTLSQLGYMTMALGASAYPVAMFHLMTHAFFKAVLFLGAGAVIVALHHEQDMRRMGALRKFMPITYATVAIGAWANAGLPPFSGFFSKESIIEAVHHAGRFGDTFAYVVALAGAFIGALYSFRLLFYAFHGASRMDHHTEEHLHEQPWVVWLPLVLLAIPSILAGWLLMEPIVVKGFFGDAVEIASDHHAMHAIEGHWHGALAMVMHGFTTLAFWLAVAGLVTAWYCYIVKPELPGVVRSRLAGLVRILEEKYGFDRFNDWFFAGGARALGAGLWKGGDIAVIDGVAVNGSARLVAWFARMIRIVQSGFIYHYAFGMIIGVFVLLTLWLWLVR